MRSREALASAIYEAERLNAPKGTQFLRGWQDELAPVKDRYYRMADYIVLVETVEHGSERESEPGNLGEVGDP